MLADDGRLRHRANQESTLTRTTAMTPSTRSTLVLPEIADDGIDQDCNGFDTVTCFVDGDQDGFRDRCTGRRCWPSATMQLRHGAQSGVGRRTRTDCDDGDNTGSTRVPRRSPTTVIDQDCNGFGHGDLLRGRSTRTASGPTPGRRRCWPTTAAATRARSGAECDEHGTTATR